MAYDEELAQRLRSVLGELPGLQEKKMFGGVGFILHGNMACGVHGNDLIVRVGVEKYQEALAQPHTHIFDMTGRPMTGWIVVDPLGLVEATELRQWVLRGVEFVKTLPDKINSKK
jgi:hypothetical protein